MHFERTELRHPPVREVAASFRYEPQIPYSLVAGRLETKLRERLSQFDENPNGLVIGPIADVLGPHGRFSSEEDSWVVQIGEGLVWINAVISGESYDFAAFKGLVNFVLEAYAAAGILEGITEASLRYINFIDVADTDPIECPFRVRWSLPSGASAAVRFSFSMSVEDEVPVQVSFRYGQEVDDATGTLLDISTKDGTPADPEAWLVKAHDRIYQCFRHILSDELHARLAQ